MSSGEELKPSPSAAAPVDKITTATAREPTKRLLGDANCVGKNDEDDEAPKTKKNRMEGGGMTQLRTNKKPTHVEVFFNGAVLAKFRDKTSVENALKLLRNRARCGTARVWLEDKDECVVLDELLSVDYSPYYFSSEEQAIPSPVETEYAYENQLKGKLHRYGSPSYDVNFIESYLSEASTFRPSTATAEDEVGLRPAMFRAFLGPSGSGKTFSAIKKPFECDLSEFDPKNHERHCTLYMAVSSVWSQGGTKSVIDGIEEGWLRTFKKKEQKLQMIVHVVVDEAGFSECSPEGFSWSIEDFSELQSRLQEHAETVLISIAGTNLEKVMSESADSADPRLAKYRPSEWKLDNLRALVPNIRDTYNVATYLTNQAAEELLESWMTRVPIFAALASNARAAVELVRILFELNDYGRDPVDNIPGVVDSVAKFYIACNAMKELNQTERRAVVKSVLKVLQAPDADDPKPVVFTLTQDAGAWD